MAEDIFKNTITLADAERMSGPLAFNLMIKPGGSLCNLDCRYCYYLDKSGLYGGREPRMTEDMLEKLIKNYLSSCDVSEVTINWHGGEPLIMGLDFYRKAIEFEKRYAEDKIVHNTLQTNGTLLTPQWADFFAENNFLIGISIDGPEHIHDRYRSSKAGEPSFSRVMAGLRTLVYGGVEFNTLTAVSKASEGHGLEIYQFLKSIGSKYMQFLPVVEKIRYQKNDSGKALKSVRPTIVNPAGESDGIGTWSISDVGYGRLLCDIFDYWVRHDVGQYFVGMFDATLAGWVGAMPGTCAYAETCGGNIVVEHNGDVYVCDHFVYPEYKLGNIATDNLRDLAGCDGAMAFGIEKRNSLPLQCRRCEWLRLCNGECPKHRFDKAKNGQAGLNSLCAGLQMFYRHSAPAMQKMKELLAQKRAPAEIMLTDFQ